MRKAGNRQFHPGAAACLATLAFLVPGCTTVEKYSLTYRTWNTEAFRNFSEPALEPNLALFKVQDDHEVLVQYDACTENNVAVKRRAYHLRHNWARVAQGRKPQFVDPSQASGLTPIPVLPGGSVDTNALPDPPGYALVVEDGRGFTVYQSAVGGETYSLPVYPESSGTAIRVALTPFAVTGDTLMVSGVVAFIGIIALAESHARWGAY